MAVDEILKKIESDAQAGAQSVVAEGKQQADEVMRLAREKADSLESQMRARADQRADEERNRVVTLARLAARRRLLGAKQGLIDRVFDETKKSVLGMAQGDYRRLIRGFLKETVETGDEEVIVAEGEKRLDQSFLDEVSREIGKGGGLRLSAERRPIEGGFVLRSGRIETNCALETILRAAREKLESEVAGILFGPGGGS